MSRSESPVRRPKMKRTGVVAAVLLVILAAPFAARAGGTIGTSFPPGFAVPTDASLGVPVLGFGAAGAVHRTPVIFLHGNNDTPYPTICNRSEERRVGKECRYR